MVFNCGVDAHTVLRHFRVDNERKTLFAVKMVSPFLQVHTVVLIHVDKLKVCVYIYIHTSFGLEMYKICRH